MDTDAKDFEHIERIPLKQGFTWIVGTMICFQILNRIVNTVGPPSSVKAADSWKWKNLFISWIHAIIVGTWDLTCMWNTPEFIKDMITFYDPSSYAMVAFSTGYFFYDFIDLIVNRQASKMWEILVHHVAVAGMFFYNVLTCRCIGYNMFALLCEVNSIFLHSRKLLQMVRMNFHHWLYRTNVYLNLFTFLTCRFVALVGITWGITVWHDRVPALYVFTLSASMFCMWVINIILFWRLLKNDILRSDRKARGDTPLRNGGQLPTMTKDDASTLHLNNNIANGLKSKDACKS